MYKSSTLPKPKLPSPTNVSNFPTKGWMSTTRPTKCVVPGCIGEIISYKDYYFKNKRILCTRAFSATAIATTIDDSAFFLAGSTELDDEMGHTSKMLRKLYKSFTSLVLGINRNSWAAACTKSAFCNLILQDIDAVMYYFDTDTYCNGCSISLHSNLANMAPTLA
jgi:hypothetical protein